MGIVSIALNSQAHYPKQQYIFRPDTKYPEYLFGDDISPEQNSVYALVRDALRYLSLDTKNYNTPNWNPLGDGYINPGNCVLIKPNLVLEKNHGTGGTECLYTHPSVTAAVIDYVCIALKGKGMIIVADAPLQTCNFDLLVNESGYKSLITYYQSKGISIEMHDLRALTSENRKDIIYASVNEKQSQNGIVVHLDALSLHSQLSENQINSERITSYDPNELKLHHTISTHEYLIDKDVLIADCVINLCKPKTHRKAGVTISLKNFVGINTRKEYLPHHRLGGSDYGGDEYLGASCLRSIASDVLDKKNICSAHKQYGRAKVFQFVLRCIDWLDRLIFHNNSSYSEGSWYGNDTLWRTICDLNRIVNYADKNGIISHELQRRILCIADMIVMGEGEGPLHPSPHHVGIIAAGENCVCFDEAISTIMGMDIEKIPSIRHARELSDEYPLVKKGDTAVIASNNDKWNGLKISEIQKKDAIGLMPSNGWVGHIELE